MPSVFQTRLRRRCLAFGKRIFLLKDADIGVVVLLEPRRGGYALPFRGAAGDERRRARCLRVGEASGPRVSDPEPQDIVALDEWNQPPGVDTRRPGKDHVRL